MNVFGHIHEGYGAEKIDDTWFLNASICTLRYQPTNKPFVFKMHKKTKETILVQD